MLAPPQTVVDMVNAYGVAHVGPLAQALSRDKDQQLAHNPTAWLQQHFFSSPFHGTSAGRRILLYRGRQLGQPIYL
jgi:hypothetical protein